jgi:methionyl-tRNA synthetase
MWDRDGDFSIERLIERYNSDLANNFGNLINRVLNMCVKYFNGTIENSPSEIYEDLKIKTKSTLLNYLDKMNNYAISDSLSSIWELVDFSNVYINDKKPWELAKNNELDKLMSLLYNLVEAIRIVSFCLYPVMPKKAEEILTLMGSANCLKEQNFDSLKKVGEYSKRFIIEKVYPIFPRIEKLEAE